MFNPRSVLVATAVAFVFVACGSEPPPPPAPVGPTPEELEQRRLDSIAEVRAAEEARARAEQERLERERAAAAARARAALAEMVFFEYDDSRLTGEGERLLRAKLEILRNNPQVRLRMEGHADERGTSEYNIALGNERAESVIQFLTGFGLDSGRFSSVSYGEERPLSNATTDAAFARNRRVEFVITGGGDSISE